MPSNTLCIKSLLRSQVSHHILFYSYNLSIFHPTAISPVLKSPHSSGHKNSMEMASTNILSPSFSLADFLGFLLFQRILNWVIRCQKSFYKFMFSVTKSNICCGRKSPSSEINETMKSTSCKQLNEKGDVKVSSEDVEMVMGKLGMLCNPDGEMLKTCFSSDELSVLFEEKEPSLEEVKEAFSVFDENGDEFIDAKELQRVLCNLGFREGSNIDACEKMIRAFDENGDGQIDFNEFVKFMENSFC
ncbi:probable calcium-binding protein CML46 [Magnolia sinica]|uniref:probable calcium-binding protein CML46 n=1 Tax=Magnolia sinica TaxID=86752 RepID=UPI002658E6FB|nr:probable calcium-binding protein CML46 [Magnolia sinica]